MFHSFVVVVVVVVCSALCFFEHKDPHEVMTVGTVDNGFCSESFLPATISSRLRWKLFMALKFFFSGVPSWDNLVIKFLVILFTYGQINITKLAQLHFKKIVNHSFICCLSTITMYLGFITTCTKTLNIHAYFTATLVYQPGCHCHLESYQMFVFNILIVTSTCVKHHFFLLDLLKEKFI